MNHIPFTACLPAAGSGTRMKSDIPKQYIALLDRPVMAHTLAIFDSMPGCRRIVIATDDRDTLQWLIDEYPLLTETVIVDGGQQRQDSVSNAVHACGDDEIVLVHDAARPCIAPELIEEVAAAVQPGQGAVLAMQARDTLKLVREGRVLETLDRSAIWHAQTPQAAVAADFKRAFEAAESDGVSGTDDVWLLERIGVTVVVVPGSPENIKITTPEDLAIAEALMLRRGAVRP
jgi:2-C-methyl-D-erythritol 4-phosphate cytidylyltransferase